MDGERKREGGRREGGMDGEREGEREGGREGMVKTSMEEIEKVEQILLNTMYSAHAVTFVHVSSLLVSVWYSQRST